MRRWAAIAAARGLAALPAISGFQVCKDRFAIVLRRMGSPSRQISSYPVDIAVRDPKDPNRFILGIECDGPKYAAQHTVRDRDVLRGDVLTLLGWKVFRAWSVDWAFDRKRAEERLLAALPRMERVLLENKKE